MKRNELLKIILIRPPSPLGKFRTVNLQHPINLCILGRIVETLKQKCFIYDFEVEGLDINKFIGFIKMVQPDVVGFSATTPQVKVSNYLSSIIKSIYPKTITILGGAHISALPVESLHEFNFIDFGFIGESDISLKKFLYGIRDGENFYRLPGIVYREKGNIVKNPQSERIDLKGADYIPARHLLNLKSYLRLNRFKNVAAPGVYKDNIMATQMFTSRGCPYKCIFCANTSNFGDLSFPPMIISRDITSVKEEIIECKKRFGINHFSIQDELFPSSREFLSEFCEIASEEQITFNCNSRVDMLKPEDFDLLGKSGCLQIGFGIESGSERILKKIGKRISLNAVANAIDYAHKYHIRTVCYFLIGSHPEEEVEDVLNTIKFIKEVKPDLITCTIAVPYPGTVLRRLLELKGLIYSNNWDEYTYYSNKPVWRTYYFTSEDLLKNQLKILRSFYLSFGTLYRRLKLMKSYSELLMLTEGTFRALKFFWGKGSGD